MKSMIEVFKTNILTKKKAKLISSLLSKTYPSLKINFDLSDCDKVLRVKGDHTEISGIMILVKKYGFTCELLD